MPQVINELGLGQSLGQSLGMGLQALLGEKVKKMQQRQQAGGLSQLLGITPDEASGLTNLDPRIQQELVKQKMQAPSREAFAGALSSLLGGGQPVSTGAEGIGAQQLSQLNPQQAIQLAQLGLQQKQLQQKEDIAKRSDERKSQQRMLESGHIKNIETVTNSREKIKSADESMRANKDVLRYLDTGNVDTGVVYAVKKGANIDKFGTSPQTQAVAKLLAAEPIRSLSSIPGQAARLSKVFDTIKDMTPQLFNTEEGLRQIAQIRIADSKAMSEFEKAKIRALESYRKKSKQAPYDLDERVAKKIKPKLDKYYSTVENLIAKSIGTKDPANLPSNFKVGQKAIWNENGLKYIIVMDKGKKVWKPLKEK